MSSLLPSLLLITKSPMILYQTQSWKVWLMYTSNSPTHMLAIRFNSTENTGEGTEAREVVGSVTPDACFDCVLEQMNNLTLCGFPWTPQSMLLSEQLRTSSTVWDRNRVKVTTSTHNHTPVWTPSNSTAGWVTESDSDQYEVPYTQTLKAVNTDRVNWEKTEAHSIL